MTLPDLASEYWRRQYMQDADFAAACTEIMLEFDRRQRMLDAAAGMAQEIREHKVGEFSMPHLARALTAYETAKGRA